MRVESVAVDDLEEEEDWGLIHSSQQTVSYVNSMFVNMNVCKLIFLFSLTDTE